MNDIKDFFYKKEYDILKDVSVTQLLDEMMKYTSPIKAKAALKFLINEYMKTHIDVSYEQAEFDIKKKIGYWAGYFDNETRYRVEELFDTEHPYFGKIKENGAPTAEEAYELGFKYVSNQKKITLKELRNLKEKKNENITCN